ncbi:MAG: winged helix-turn-helix domain-containing protein [bacterium]|nr:winged helix-turn-helix domain-containing protein [bacterium]
MRKTRPSDSGIGSWSVHPSEFLVNDGRRDVRLEPRAMDVLCYLARHRGTVVPNDELKSEVWGTPHVVDAAVQRCISQIRAGLGDDPARPAFIETMGHGHRLLPCLVRVEPVRADQRGPTLVFAPCSTALA